MDTLSFQPEEHGGRFNPLEVLQRIAKTTLEAAGSFARAHTSELDAQGDRAVQKLRELHGTSDASIGDT